MERMILIINEKRGSGFRPASPWGKILRQDMRIIPVKYNEVKISLGKTINLGNYESRRVDIQLSAVVEDGENVNEVIANVRAKCDDQLDNIIMGEPSQKSEFDNFIF